MGDISKVKNVKKKSKIELEEDPLLILEQWLSPSLLCSSTIQALFNCTLGNIQIESKLRHLSKNRALEDTHCAKRSIFFQLC